MNWTVLTGVAVLGGDGVEQFTSVSGSLQDLLRVGQIGDGAIKGLGVEHDSVKQVGGEQGHVLLNQHVR